MGQSRQLLATALERPTGILATPRPCNVPNTYSDTSLSLWCKHQRRQYNRLCKGLGSTMTQERYQALQSLGFDWNPRNLKQG
jgi:Helicase associated domain